MASPKQRKKDNEGGINQHGSSSVKSPDGDDKRLNLKEKRRSIKEVVIMRKMRINTKFASYILQIKILNSRLRFFINFRTSK